MPTTTTRLQQLAELYAVHNESLQRLVANRATTDRATIEDACSFAWTQLLTHEDVDLTPPHWASLAWLTQTAMHEAWRLQARADRTIGVDAHTLERLADDSGRNIPSADDIALQRARLDLVAQIPKRPRRFLLRLMLGYSYAEMGQQEGATLTTTNKQIARAKRLLREIEARKGG